jgi:hypothetical protein
MSDNTCLRCGRPTPDGYACTRCGVTRPSGWLAEITDIMPAARDVAMGLSGSQGSGGMPGKPESRLPLNLAATARLDAVANALGTWVRHVAQERGQFPDSLPYGFDTIVNACRFLAGQLEWFRHRPEVDECLSDLEASARVIRGIVRGPSDLKFLGPCGSTVRYTEAEEGCPVNCACHNGPHYACDEPGGCGTAGCGRPALVAQPPCPGDVYALVYDDGTVAPVGRCRGKTCRAEWDTAQRQAWLTDQVVEHLADTPIPASMIAHAVRVNVNTIRTWAHTVRADNGTVLRAPKLATFYAVGEHFVPWDEPDHRLPAAARRAALEGRGPRLHFVADVMELARAAAARKERREAAKAAESEEGAA